MKPFLETAAFHIFSQHSLRNLSNVCVILPSKRSVLYFKKALGACSSVPFLAPHITDIDDFILKTTGLRQIDQVSLLFELFDIFKEIDPEVSFDRFTTWAPTLLQDFDKIDQYLSDDNTKALFAWVANAKALERWGITHTKENSATDRYFKLFENIGRVYAGLKQRLKNKNLAYRGMAYKHLADNVFELLLDKQLYAKFYLVGFNALSDSEEKIFRELMKEEGRAEAIWDTDDYYMNSFRMEAGNLLRLYKGTDERQIHRKIGKTWNWQGNLLTRSPKNMQIIGVTNASMQAKVAGHIYQQWKPQPLPSGEGGNLQSFSMEGSPPHWGGAGGGVSTALVLGDETLLMPVLYSLDETITDLNITMGVSLRNSMIFTLIDAIFELQRNMVEFRTEEGTTLKIPKFSHRHIDKVLNHPLLRRYELLSTETEHTTSFREVLKQITAKNLVFLAEKEIKEMGENSPLFEVLFSRWNNNPRRAIQAFYDLIDLLRTVYRERKDDIENEYLYLFFRVLKRLEGVLATRSDSLNIKNLKLFLYEFLKQEKIPFASDQDHDLQIMGMLETRTLDFERLIILSVNEGVLPQGKKANSLIPFDAAIEFGLPTHGEMDAVMAYHFFRLLQRAKEVVLVYVQPSDTYGAGEKSRFLLQIEHELSKKNPQMTLTYPTVSFEEHQGQHTVAIAPDDDLQILKTQEILAFLKNDLAEKGLFPSHLNQYVRCSLQYYFNRVAQIKDEEVIEEKLGTDQFGTWVHNTLEEIDQQYFVQKGKPQEADIKRIIAEIPLRLQENFKKTYGGLRFNEGMNYILYEIAQKLLTDFFKEQTYTHTLADAVLEVERKLTASFTTPEGLTVKIAGRIDRLDLVGNTLRVIDYKTGKVEAKDLKATPEAVNEKLLEDSDMSWEKIRQLWLYKYIVLKGMQAKNLHVGGLTFSENTHQVAAGIFSFRNIKGGFMSSDVAFEAGESNAQFIQHSEEALSDFIAELTDPEIPFARTDNLKTCEYCDFRGICGR